MKNLFSALSIVCTFVACRAALPPGVADEAKANADQVLLIQVDSANLVGDEAGGCTPKFNVDATVIAVNQTTSGLTTGETLAFNSYVVDRESVSCEGFVGPLSPPKLEPGWCGYVYLNEGDEEGNIMELAAWGHSFVPAPEEACRGMAPDAPANNSDDVDIDSTQGDIEEDETSQEDSSQATRVTAITTMAGAFIGLFMM